MAPSHALGNDSSKRTGANKKNLKRGFKMSRSGRKTGKRESVEDPDLSSGDASPCSLRGVSSGTLDADIHTWSTNTTDYDGGASCSSSSAARTSYPSIHVLGYRHPSESGASYVCSALD